MTGEQVRQARELLSISQERLTRLSGVPSNAIGIFERENYMPPPRYKDGDRTAAVRAALEEAGIEFTGGDSPGVKLRKDSAK